MQTIKILIGSTLGGAEYVAEHIEPMLNKAGFSTELITEFDHWQPEFKATDIWLIITSTHGAGDLPDNILPMYTTLATQQPALYPLNYGVIAIGDSSYDTFCEAGLKMDALLEQLAAQRIGTPLLIDVQAVDLPEDQAEQWIPTWIDLIQN